MFQNRNKYLFYVKLYIRAVMTSLVLCKGLAWNIYKVSNIQSITKGLFIITFHNFVLA